MKIEKSITIWFFVFIIMGEILSGSLHARETGFAIPDPVKVTQLVNNAYFGALRLGYYSGRYLDHNFGLSSVHDDSTKQSFTWITQRGSYEQLLGYWIFRANTYQCWQAVRANGPLILWNPESHAKSNPEDWELFVFEYANPAGTEVFIRNIHGRYVRYASPVFVCDADRANAASFVPEFIPELD
ncbi:hypothetical protein [Parachlamydia sp. AcF125]|uniref:hypothetical protein n=1 Tax=Parachlamydia sp. AcF125 TaxID=2795736 RepID=UPI001BC9F277|nr:hypothetical protein [Parachlamydia sp. AcF125]MBS4168351.1 hypothetical protein [Parachlamydia sp. AcF125]